MSRSNATRRGRALRIIGGRWRGRRIRLPETGDVRPTGDRVRETLFNWLAPTLEGARCLDLFAGSGALGIEALSRGAGGVVFVERDRGAARALAATLDTLDCDAGEVVSGDARAYLRGPPVEFDVVFLDPPFGAIDWINLCTLLDNGWLARHAQIYIEIDRRDEFPDLPAGWTVARDKTAGQVRFALVRCDDRSPDTDRAADQLG